MRTGLPLIAVLAFVASSQGGDDGERPKLAMSKAVACAKIEGFDLFEPLEEAAVTADEKMLVYYRPMHFGVEAVGDKYRAHLVQDSRIRRRGEKAILRKKDAMVDYEAKADFPPTALYMTNSVGLKGLEPGEYDLEIILHDRIRTGETATQILPFRIKPTPKPAEEKGEAESKDRPGPTTPKRSNRNR